MDKIKKVMFMLCVVALGAGIAIAEQRGLYVFKGADAQTAIRVKYTGSSSTATFTNDTDQVVLYDGTTTTTIAGAGQAYSNIVDSINSATNTSGTIVWEAEFVGAIRSDVASNFMIAATAQTDMTDGKWHESCKMDTSGIKAYPVGVPGDDYGNLYVDHIYGNVAGTGDVTVNIWIDGTKVYEDYVVSPVYSTSDGTVFNTNAVVSLNLDLGGHGIMVPSGKPVAVRATRATTATTGNLGVTFTKR